MVGGKLKAIEADAFESTHKLEQISLQGNQINYVGKATFDNLAKLSVLKFNNNPCHSGVSLKRNGVASLIKQIESKCQDSSLSSSSQNEPSTSSQQLESSTSSQNFNEVEKLELKIKNKTEEFLRLETENEDLKSQLEGFKKRENEQRIKIDEFNKKIGQLQLKITEKQC